MFCAGVLYCQKGRGLPVQQLARPKFARASAAAVTVRRGPIRVTLQALGDGSIATAGLVGG